MTSTSWWYGEEDGVHVDDDHAVPNVGDEVHIAVNGPGQPEERFVVWRVRHTVREGRHRVDVFLRKD